MLGVIKGARLSIFTHADNFVLVSEFVMVVILSE